MQFRYSIILYVETIDIPINVENLMRMCCVWFPHRKAFRTLVWLDDVSLELHVFLELNYFGIGSSSWWRWSWASQPCTLFSYLDPGKVKTITFSWILVICRRMKVIFHVSSIARSASGRWNASTPVRDNLFQMTREDRVSYFDPGRN